MMALFDLLGRSWAMGIIWNLSDAPATFRSLQAKCETVSPSVLNSRLKELRESGIIERTGDGYGLTNMGRELLDTLKPLAEWSWKWADTVKKTNP
jgi:DNA-binding HxlR family transcriptional regulator